MDYRGFRIFSHKFQRMAGKILVQCIFSGNQCNGRLLSTATYPPASLPGGDHRSGIAHQDAQIQITNINPQFQSTGGDDRQKISVGQTLFDLTALFREKTGPVGADL